jgi:hypothetical protein
MFIVSHTRARTGARRGFGRVTLAVALKAVIALLAAASAAASPQHGAYSLRPIAFIGAPAPGGGAFTTDFEPSAINDSGQVGFTADIDAVGEGVFVARGGTISQVMRAGLTAPGGFTFGPGELGRLGMNDGGDVGVGFILNPFDSSEPFGLGDGVFRFSHNSGALGGVELPGTPAPGGGTFQGTFFNDAINNRGDIVYPGLATGSAITAPGTPPNTDGMALALFLQRRNGTNTRVVGPGDAAPGGHVFDDAWNGSPNDAGDIVFSGHVVGDPCVDIGNPWACGDSLYLRDATTGAIQSIAHQGDPAPGGGTFSTAFGGLVNSSDQIALIGALGPPFSGRFGVYRYAKGALTAVAKPGDPMPGGGAFLSAGGSSGMIGLNNRGDISFAASLNTDTTGDGLFDTGVYVASLRSLRLVARSGTIIPGVGTISRIGSFIQGGTNSSPPYGTGGMINNSGRVLLNATLTDGRDVMVVASP